MKDLSMINTEEYKNENLFIFNNVFNIVIILEIFFYKIRNTKS